MIEIYDPKTNSWRSETKEEVLEHEDIEGNKPCDLCWEQARSNGVYSFPLKNSIVLKRCPCGRMIGIEKCVHPEKTL